MEVSNTGLNYFSAMYLLSFICSICTTILICHCMHVSIRFDRVVGTELGDSRPFDYMDLISSLKASLMII